MKTSLDFFDHIGTIFDHLLSSQGTLSPTRQNTILHEYNCRVIINGVVVKSVSGAIGTNKQFDDIYSFNVE